MKLNIRNFAKINEADIVIDGITVIAGENNTGKSTVGKILFSLFNALSDIDRKIFEERIKEIEVTNTDIMLNHISVLDLPRSVATRTVLNNVREINIQLRKQIDENLCRKRLSRNEPKSRKHYCSTDRNKTGLRFRSCNRFHTNWNIQKPCSCI